MLSAATERLERLMATAATVAGGATDETVDVHLTWSNRDRSLIAPRPQTENPTSAQSASLMLTRKTRAVHAVSSSVDPDHLGTVVDACRDTVFLGASVAGYDRPRPWRLADPLRLAESADLAPLVARASAFTAQDSGLFPAALVTVIRRHEVVAFASTGQEPRGFVRTVCTFGAMFPSPSGVRGTVGELATRLGDLDIGALRRLGTWTALANAAKPGTGPIGDAILLPPTVSATLLHLLASDLVTRPGFERHDGGLAIKDNPHCPGAPDSGLFDEEGYPTRGLDLLTCLPATSRGSLSHASTPSTGHARRQRYQTVPEPWPSNVSVVAEVPDESWQEWTGSAAHGLDTPDSQTNRAGDALTVRLRMVACRDGEPYRRIGTLTVSGNIGQWCAALDRASTPLGHVRGSLFSTGASWMVIDLNGLEVNKEES